MLRKGSTYYTKAGLKQILKVINNQKIRIVFFTLFCFYSANHYLFDKKDMVVIKTIGNYKISMQVIDSSRRYKIDPLLVTSLIVSESNSYQYAVSNKNAKGLMQLMPATALLILKNTKNKVYQKMQDYPGIIYRPEINIELALIHLKDMYHYKSKHWDSALHIYNLSANSYAKGQRNHAYVNGILKRVKVWRS